MNIEKRGTGRTILKNSSTFTGTITINNGVLEVSSLGANEGSEHGALGQYTNVITLNNGGMLATTFTGKASHPIVANEGGIEVAKSTILTVVGAGVTGNGTFIKGGEGQINFSNPNDVAVCRIDEGIVYDEGDTHSVAKLVVFNGTNVEFMMNNSCYSYSSNSTNFEVPEGKSGKLTLDGRCTYTGTLTGSGTLEVFAPWIRNELKGNWSAFEGTLIASQETNKNNTVNKYGSDFIFANSNGLPKATLSIASGTTFNCTVNNVHFGNITGLGVLGGDSHNYYVGGLGGTSTFEGTFGKIGVFKEGTGSFILTKEQPDLLAIHVYEGELMLKGANTDVKFTGTMPMIVKGTLSGNGTVSSSKATFEKGSVLNPTHTTKALKTARRTIRFTGDLVMDPESSIALTIVAADKYSKFICDGAATLTKDVTVTLNGYTPKLGDEFVFWEAPENTVKPNVQMPALPEGFGWDMSHVTATEGRVIVSDHTGIEDIAADAEVRCIVVSIDGIVLIDTTTNAGNVKALCNELGAGTYIVRMTNENIDQTEKVIVR